MINSVTATCPQAAQNGQGRFGVSQDSLRPVRFDSEAVKRVLNAFLKGVQP